MTKSKATSRPFEQTAQQRAELDALRRMLDLSQGTFSLSVAICNSPALRDHIIEYLTSEMQGIEVVRIPEDAQDIFDSVLSQAPNQQPRAIFVVDMEKALAGDKRDCVVQGLNVSREQWRCACQSPIVFWLPEYVIGLLTKQARDLWSWVSHHFEFVSERATALTGQQDVFAGDTLLAGNLDVHEKHLRIAELEERIADIGEQPKEQLIEYELAWLSELAYLYRSLGDLDKAEKAVTKALEVSRELGRLEGMASAYGDLGIIYAIRGDLDKAKTMLNKALDINQKLGRREGMATQYGNLGLIYRKCGDLNEAEKMHKKALEINRKLGRLEGMANAYGGLGLIHWIRDDLDKAEKMHSKSLEIDRKLGSLEGMAINYGNLGLIYWKRGDLDEAERMYDRAFEIDEKLGRLEGMANHYGNLGLIYGARGDLDEAERMFNKALEIDQKLGRLEGMAIQYANLGQVYKTRGDLAQAREFWEKASALHQKIGAKDQVRTVQALIDALPKNGQ